MKYLISLVFVLGCGDNIHPPTPEDPDYGNEDVTEIEPGDLPDAGVDAAPDAADSCDDQDDNNCHWHNGHWHCDKNDHEHNGHWHHGHL